MSLIYELGDNNENLLSILDRYENELTLVEQHLSIEGKLLERANIEQATWQAYYDQRRIELYTLTKHFESEVARVRGKLWVKYSENMSIALGPKDKDQYINNEQAYLNINQLYLEVQELYKKYDAVVEAFKSRGYALNNIVRIRVAEMENVSL